MDGRFFNREGCLISGFRPAIILSNDLNNRNFECQIATVITLTTSLLKGGFETRIKIKANSNLFRIKIYKIYIFGNNNKIKNKKKIFLIDYS